MAVADNRKLPMLVIAVTLLLVLSVALSTVLGPFMERFGETALRKARYEKAVRDKGVNLHKGMYWKEKE